MISLVSSFTFLRPQSRPRAAACRAAPPQCSTPIEAVPNRIRCYNKDVLKSNILVIRITTSAAVRKTIRLPRISTATYFSYRLLCEGLRFAEWSRALTIRSSFACASIAISTTSTRSITQQEGWFTKKDQTSRITAPRP